MTGLYVEWGKELADEADYLAAIATYRRIPQEVADPRLWTAADDYIVDAYCVYSASARAAGDVGWATALCREVSAELPSLAAERCPRCVE